MSPWNSNRRIVPLVTVLALGFLVACGSGGPNNPDQSARAEINAMLPQELSAEDVTRVRVEVRGPGIPAPVGLDLTRQGATWQGTLTDIPAGLDRVFEAKAYDAGSTLLYQGQAGPLTISAGSTVSVAILLQQVNPEPPFQNVAPVIDSLVVSANQVAPGGTLTLTATAHDDNPGDTITYAWTATAGTFSAPASATTSWVAPSTEGAQVLRLEVRDSRNTSARMSVDISVQRPGSTGSAAVTVTFNTWPSVTAMMAAPSVLTLNVSSQIAAVVSDPDGDTLNYSWSSDCPGSFSESWTATPSFTLFATPFTGNRCLLTVSASDGRGGQHTGTLTLMVGPVPRANVAPQVDSTFKSSEQAGSGELVTMGLTAHDPESAALTYAWTTNQGAIQATRGTSTSSEVDWRAPACLNGPAILTAAITDAGGATTRQQFSIAPRAGSACGGMVVTGVRNSHRVRADGAVIVVPMDLSGVTIGAWVPTPDGSGYNWRPGTGQASGTFLIPNVESTPYLLQLDTSYVWATSRTLDLSQADLGRPDVQLEPEGTQLSVQLHGLSPWQDRDDLQLHAANAGIGYFSAASCTAPSWSPPLPGDSSFFNTIDYVSSLQNCGLPAARLEAARGDVLYVTQLVSRSEGGMNFQELLRSYQTTSLSGGGGGSLTLNGFMSPLPTVTRALNYPASSFEALALAAHPTAVLTTTSLNIGIMPGYTQFGSYTGWPDLVLASGPAGRGDLVTSFTYGNPYPGAWPQFITALSSAGVRYSVVREDGSTSTPRSFSVYTYSQQPVTGVTTSLTPRVGPARDMRINGSVATGPLTNVGLTPLLSWMPPSLGTPNYYSVRVYELFATSSGGTSRLPVLPSLTTTQTQVRLPPGVLEAGKTYYVQVNAVSQPSADPARPFISGPTYYLAMAVTGSFRP